jgi:hypothetical protein
MIFSENRYPLFGIMRADRGALPPEAIRLAARLPSADQ